MTTIAIQVDEDLAQVFQTYDLEEQEAIQKLLNEHLREVISSQNLKHSIEVLRTEAEANGLTPEILQEILNEED